MKSFSRFSVFVVLPCTSCQIFAFKVLDILLSGSHETMYFSISVHTSSSSCCFLSRTSSKSSFSASSSLIFQRRLNLHILIAMVCSSVFPRALNSSSMTRTFVSHFILSLQLLTQVPLLSFASVPRLWWKLLSTSPRMPTSSICPENFDPPSSTRENCHPVFVCHPLDDQLEFSWSWLSFTLPKSFPPLISISRE